MSNNLDVPEWKRSIVALAFGDVAANTIDVNRFKDQETAHLYAKTVEFATKLFSIEYPSDSEARYKAEQNLTEAS